MLDGSIGVERAQTLCFSNVHRVTRGRICFSAVRRSCERRRAETDRRHQRHGNEVRSIAMHELVFPFRAARLNERVTTSPLIGSDRARVPEFPHSCVSLLHRARGRIAIGRRRISALPRQ
jgi:hypothetical protein